MTRKYSAGLAALLLSGTLASAQAPSPTPSDAPPPVASQPPAPIQRQAPTAPIPPVAPRPTTPHMLYRGPMGMGDRVPGMEFRRSTGAGFRIVPPGMWWRDPDVVQRLSLTAEQTKRMDDIFQRSRLQLIDLRANIEKQNALLDPMLSANPIEQTKTLLQIDKVAQARAELEKADAKMLLGIRGVLTPEQWTKLQSRDRARPGLTPAAPSGWIPGDPRRLPRPGLGHGGPAELPTPQP